jgi:hypothetical protein
MKFKHKIKSEKHVQKVNIKCTVVGEPQRSKAKTYRDRSEAPETHLFKALHASMNKILQKNLKIAQLKASRGLEEELQASSHEG